MEKLEETMAKARCARRIRLLTMAAAITTVGAGAQVALAGWFGPHQREPEFYFVQKAHHHFIKKEFSKMMAQVKYGLALKGTPVAVRNNLLDLVRKTSIELKGREIPVDWSLPPQVRFLAITFRRIELGSGLGTEFRLRVSGTFDQKYNLDQVQLVRFPEQVILDRKKKIGFWNTNPTQQSETHFNLERRDVSKPPESGLYLLRLKAKNEPVREGWVILDRMDAKKTPVIMQPTNGSTVDQPQPTFRWSPFVSDHYLGVERLAMHLGVYRINSETGSWGQPIWAFTSMTRNPTQVKVGTVFQNPQASASGVEFLEEGPHAAVLSFVESFQFGPVHISREATAHIKSFNVKFSSQ